jgi:hypothetical protein
MWDLRALLSSRMRAKRSRNHAFLEMRGFLRLLAGAENFEQMSCHVIALLI